jgi:hypothetical protein
MKVWVWPCEMCASEIPVEPMATSQYRSITCEACGATYAVLNSELSVKEISD